MLKKAIAVVTSGGDSPGMNAAARAVVRTALYEGVDVYGVHNGYSGMVHDDIEQLTSRSVSDLIQRGGTFLGTARSKTFMTPEGRKTAYENLRKRNIEGLVIIGGEGVALASLSGDAVREGIGEVRDPRATSIRVTLSDGSNEAWSRGAGVIALQGYIAARAA